MRRLAFGLVVALAVPLGLSPASSSAGRSKPACVVKGSKTVVKTRSVRVYTREVNRGDLTERLYGCLYRTNTRFLLDSASDDGFGLSEEFRQVKLRGRFVAWEHVSTDNTCRAACPPGYDPATESIALADLRLRTRTRFSGTPRAGTLAVTAGGTVSWIDDPTGEQRTRSPRR